MRRSVVALLGLVGGTARADVADLPMTIVGEVMSTTSRWTADRSRIVTEAVVHTDEGDVVVSQLGGRADGFGMKVWHGPEPLVQGMQVSLSAIRRRDLSLREHVVVEQVRVMARPPGFVRTGPTDAGHYLYWRSGCVIVTPDAAGTNQVNADNEFEAIVAAVDEWNTRTGNCSYMNIVLEEPVASEVGNDTRNLIKFRDATWCRPATKDDPARCHDPAAAGITVALYIDDARSDRDGEIVDADIELNGANFALAVAGQSTGTNSCRSEVQNTLTHELGHLMGIEHPCLADEDPQRFDNNGDPVPDCGAVSDPAILEATMYNFQDCDETSKTTLEADDIDALCTMYPKASDPNSCEPFQPPTGCCKSSTAPHPGSLLLGLGVFVLLVRKRKTSLRR